MGQNNTPIGVRDIFDQLPMAVITNVRILTEETAAMPKQLLAERTLRFRQPPVDRGYATLDGIDAGLHLAANKSRGPARTVKIQRRPNPRIYRNHRATIRRFYGFVYGNLEPEVPESVALDATFRFRDLGNRRLLEKTYRTNGL